MVQTKKPQKTFLRLNGCHLARITPLKTFIKNNLILFYILSHHLIYDYLQDIIIHLLFLPQNRNNNIIHGEREEKLSF